MVLNKKSLQEYPANNGVPQGSILDTTLSQQYINDLPCNVICTDYLLMILLSTLSVMMRHMISELESDL